LPRLYFVRHGESEANRLNVFSNRAVAHRLTETGRTQVERLAAALVDIQFTAFLCSPVPRAVESAGVLSDRLGIDFEVTAALAEYDMGILEGHSDEASWQQYYALRDAWLHQHDWDARIEGGESFNDIRARFVPLIDSLRTRPAEENVLLLGHGGTFICMLPQLMSNVDAAFATQHGIDHADAIIADLDGRAMTCLTWGRHTP
jgi:probable phosphoglycerate mutase